MRFQSDARQMNEAVVFDSYGSISESRKDFLEWLLLELGDAQALKTALDVGCGVGYFSNFLQSRQLSITGLDARANNITEAKRRYPNIPFHVGNIEDPRVREFGVWDVVLSFGLLYHLENPFCAIRNLHALTRQFAVIESMVVPCDSPVGALVDEEFDEDQGLNYVALVPSESCLVKMLYRAGFVAVYKPLRMPEHVDFRPCLAYKRKRTVLVAAKAQLMSTALMSVGEKRVRDVWQRTWGYRADLMLQWTQNWLCGQRRFHS
jgi:SAM-dependent methyltransferase